MGVKDHLMWNVSITDENIRIKKFTKFSTLTVDTREGYYSTSPMQNNKTIHIGLYLKNIVTK